MSKNKKDKKPIGERFQDMVDAAEYDHFIYVKKQSTNQQIMAIPKSLIHMINFYPIISDGKCVGGEVTLFIEGQDNIIMFHKDILIATAFACAIKKEVHDYLVQKSQ